MMKETRKRIKVLPGDVYELILKNGKKKYFQFILIDYNFLGADLVRVYIPEFELDNHLPISEIVQLPIERYTYTSVQQVYKKALCNKIGNIALEQVINLPIFKSSNNPFSQNDNNWYLYEVGKKSKFIGVLDKIQNMYPLKIVHMPESFRNLCEFGLDNMD